MDAPNQTKGQSPSKADPKDKGMKMCEVADSMNFLRLWEFQEFQGISKNLIGISRNFIENIKNAKDIHKIYKQTLLKIVSRTCISCHNGNLSSEPKA